MIDFAPSTTRHWMGKDRDLPGLYLLARCGPVFRGSEMAENREISSESAGGDAQTARREPSFCAVQTR
jgi:hypothetical protein